MNATPKSPHLSVILVTSDSYQLIRRAISALRMQTAVSDLELVIVCQSEERLQINEDETANFCSVRVVEMHPIRTLSAARVVGINAASAPLVALGEDHAFPEPSWAKALIQAHRECLAAAVGPAFLNANPGLLSWLSLIMDYGRWIDPVSGGPTDDLPGHNSAWKRDLLLDYGPALERMMRAPTLMHWDLRSKGHQLYLEPTAKVHHVNIGEPVSFFLDHFYGAQVFAATRAVAWPWIRRMAYGAAAPLFMVRRARTWKQNIRRLGLDKELLPKVWPILLVSAGIATLGEALGHIFGLGRAEQRIFGYDSKRSLYVGPGERELFSVTSDGKASEF